MIKVEAKKLFPFLNRKITDRELGQGYITMRVFGVSND